MNVLELEEPAFVSDPILGPQPLDDLDALFEALTAVVGACLALYDMAKALDRSIEIREIVLLEKTGGRSGTFRR